MIDQAGPVGSSGGEIQIQPKRISKIRSTGTASGVSVSPQNTTETTSRGPENQARPLLFAELCAGTAALSLRLAGGPRARPPVSRMGSKVGYGEAILRIMGLQSGIGADRFLWCDPDPGVRLLLSAYRDRDLAREAARCILAWKDEEPRALWERLKAEGPARISDDLPEREIARWARIVTSNRLINLSAETWTNTGEGGSTFGGSEFCTPCPALSEAFSKLPGPLPAVILPGAVYPAPRFPEGRRVVVYIDPPYVGTTGYGHNLTRAEVIRLAQAWHDAGAEVYISEAEPIEIPGWEAVDITGERKGQKRTFSKQQREYVTCSHAPHWRPSVQSDLFSGLLFSGPS